jgi:hypothetical protein
MYQLLLVTLIGFLLLPPVHHRCNRGEIKHSRERGSISSLIRKIFPIIYLYWMRRKTSFLAR